MKKSSVVLLLGKVHAASANRSIREFTVRIYNPMDVGGLCPSDYPDKPVKGYLEPEILEDVLCNLRDNIQVCYHHSRIGQVLKEEDSG